jgi:hypothetical protein
VQGQLQAVGGVSRCSCCLKHNRSSHMQGSSCMFSTVNDTRHCPASNSSLQRQGSPGTHLASLSAMACASGSSCSGCTSLLTRPQDSASSALTLQQGSTAHSNMLRGAHVHCCHHWLYQGLLLTACTAWHSLASERLCLHSRSTYTGESVVHPVCAQAVLSSSGRSLHDAAVCPCFASSPHLLAVSMTSIARARPTRRGSLCVPPMPGMTPSVTSGWWPGTAGFDSMPSVGSCVKQGSAVHMCWYSSAYVLAWQGTRRSRAAQELELAMTAKRHYPMMWLAIAVHSTYMLHPTRSGSPSQEPTKGS